MERRESWKIHLADQLLREGDLKKRETKDHFLVWGSSRVNIRFADMRTAAAAAKSLQSCPTLCNPIDGRSPGSAVPGILQARTMEWVAISFSNAWKWKVKVKSLSRVRLLATPWTAAYEAPPSMGFSQARVLEWGAIAFSNMRTRWRKRGTTKSSVWGVN